MRISVFLFGVTLFLPSCFKLSTPMDRPDSGGTDSEYFDDSETVIHTATNSDIVSENTTATDTRPSAESSTDHSSTQFERDTETEIKEDAGVETETIFVTDSLSERDTSSTDRIETGMETSFAIDASMETEDAGMDSDNGSSCAGCEIQGNCHLVDAVNPENVCEKCDPVVSSESWSANDGASCDDDQYCNGGDICKDRVCSVHEGSPCGDNENCDEISDTCICSSGWTGDDCERCLIFVDGDSGDDDTVDEQAGRSWDRAFLTVQKGIDEAARSGCEIWVAASSSYYVESIKLLDNVALYGGFSGNETMRAQRDWRQNVTVLDGDATATVVSCTEENGCGSGTIIDGFTIKNGSALNGGGMYNENTSPTVSNCTFIENSANLTGGLGGGMCNEAASPMVSNCIFESNTAGTGGGMYNANGSTPIVTDCTFLNNGAFGSSGGMGNSYSSPIIINSVFQDNEARGSGGMGNSYSSPVITNCVFSDNRASLGDGGAVSNGNSSPVITNCTFASNSASTSGGGLSNREGSSPTLTNCILWGNTASSEPEIYNADAESQPVVGFSDVQGGYTGFGNIDESPLFETDSFRLQSMSPCIDTGYVDALPLDTTDLDGDGYDSELIPYDLDNNPRVTGDSVDMGAYEH